MTYRNDGITRRAHYNIMFCSRTIDVCTRAPVDAVTVWRFAVFCWFCTRCTWFERKIAVTSVNRIERKQKKATGKKVHDESH